MVCVMCIEAVLYKGCLAVCVFNVVSVMFLWMLCLLLYV